MIGYPRLDFFTVTSTLDVAREQERRGAPHGTLITASHQTVGRGRRGASWRDEPGASALPTFILRPGSELAPANAWRIPFIASLAVVEALHGLGFPFAQVKWPNDLAIGGRKVGGLLVETTGQAYLLGIGINAAQESFAQAAEFATEPVSLRIAAREQGRDDWPNAPQVAGAVAASLDTAWRRHLSSGAALLDAWRAYQMTGHRQSGIDLETGAVVAGIYRDVRDADGAALIEASGETVLRAAMPTAA